MRIVMVGSGYVGLVSGACFADFGHDVVCVDKDSAKIEALRAGRIPIFEPGLGDLVAKGVRAGQLTFTTDLQAAVTDADAVFIAVGTPSRRGDGYADLSYVYAASREIGEAMGGYTVVVTKSTVPVGTGDEVERVIREVRPDAEFSVVSNPEFLREGAAINDFKRPDRIVVGANDERAREVMAAIYRPLHLNQSPLMFTDRRTSELTKYAANAFLATKITFINEIADLCEAAEAVMSDVTFARDAYSCLEGADAMCLVTEWDMFRGLDLARVKRLLAQPVVIDLRNVYRATDMQRLGFTYVSVGRPSAGTRSGKAGEPASPETGRILEGGQVTSTASIG